MPIAQRARRNRSSGFVSRRGVRCFTLEAVSELGVPANLGTDGFFWTFGIRPRKKKIMRHIRALDPGPDGRHQVLSLFTGAGGLDLGLEEAGFATRLCVEIDPAARETIARNGRGWKLATPGDIHALSPQKILELTGVGPGQLALLAGGPPCQPFSKSSYWANGGKTRRLNDPRAATLQAYLDVVAVTRPRTLLLENVRGLAYQGKSEGLHLLQSGLEEINTRYGTAYKPQLLAVNAADFGVPQIRERVFIFASQDGRQLAELRPTHGTDSEAYLTAWDAIGDLDTSSCPAELAPTGRWADLLPTIPEGQNYLWHTPRNKVSGARPLFGWRTRFWSFLLKLAKSEPSWTIQALPGPATGPFHWKSRLLSTEEMARLQTFPAGYPFHGDRRAAQRQIGNAVPCAIGELLGLAIRRDIFGEQVRRRLRLIPTRRDDCPDAERPKRVPKRYLPIAGDHAEHPGVGLGPGAARLRSTAEV
jgi:DNA (cytosine-5)-methyltransferase 1